MFCTRNFKQAADNSFSEVRTTMQRARSTAIPTLKAGLSDSYNSISDFAKHVAEHPECLSYTAEDGSEIKLEGILIDSSSKKSKKKKLHFLMYDEKLIREFKETEIHLDGTFFTRPKIKGVSQFFTIMATKYNEVIFLNSNDKFCRFQYYQKLDKLCFNNKTLKYP